MDIVTTFKKTAKKGSGNNDIWKKSINSKIAIFTTFS